jgi:hypothetical protein
MNKVMCVLLIILSFSSVAEASNWQFITPLGAENYGFYIDMDSLRRLPKNNVRFWYAVAKTLKDTKKDTGRRHYIEMDCLNKRFRDITYEREQAPIVWENISPDSFQESFHDIVCHKTDTQENDKPKRTAASLSQENDKLKRTAASLSQENDKLKRMIEESRKVDIQIDDKKKEQAK